MKQRRPLSGRWPTLTRTRQARHNAEVYGVAESIEFTTGDFFEVGVQLRGDMVLFSPPWGGPEYNARASFDLQTMEPPLRLLHRTGQSIAPKAAYLLPRNSELSPLIEVAAEAALPLRIEQLAVDRKCKCICAYIGDFG